jgi:hypothetical protein
MHPTPNIRAFPVQPPPLAFSPPPDDMDFNDDNASDNPGHNNPGHNNPGHDNPGHDGIQGNVPTLRHPILNGMSFIHTFLFCFRKNLL